MRRARWICACLGCFAAIGVNARADGLPDSFTLGAYVPESCWMYVNVAPNPKRAEIDARWARVWDAVCNIGLLDDVKRIILQSTPQEQQEEFLASWNQVSELVGKVDWRKLNGGEFAFAFEFSPLPSHIFLFRTEPGSGRQIAEAMGALVEHLADQSFDTTFRKYFIKGVDRWSLYVHGAPVTLDVINKGDLIGISTSPLMTKRVISLIVGDGKRRAIVETRRFREALKDMPAAEDSVFFMDLRRGFGDFERMLGAAFSRGRMTADSGRPEDALVQKILSRFDVFEHVVSTQRTDGLQQSSETFVRLREDRRQAPFVGVLAERPPIHDVVRLIPAEAATFTASSGIDWTAGYRFLMDILTHDVPDGEKAVEAWKGFQEQVGFDIERDLLSWVSGEMVTFSAPSATPQMFGMQDSVVLVRVKDNELAQSKLAAALQWVTSVLADKGEQFSVSTPDAVSVDAPGFKQIVYPQVAMFLRPVVGVHGEWLIVGTSERAVNLHLATAAGKAPNVLENPRFAREGLKPGRAVTSAGFEDLTDLGKSLSMGLNMASLFGGAAGQAMPDDESRQFITNILTLARKLSPVFAQLNFISSSSSEQVFTGEGWRIRQVVTYLPHESDDELP